VTSLANLANNARIGSSKEMKRKMQPLEVAGYRRIGNLIRQTKTHKAAIAVHWRAMQNVIEVKS
jgi:hypothetical protein